jgi:hypothetical protein
MPRPFRVLPAVGAGLVGGAVFLVIELVFLPIANHVPPDWILRLIASLAAGPITLSWPAGQIGGLIVDALAAHAALSVAYAIVLCRMEDEVSPPESIAVGALMGFAIYLVNFYLFSLIFPWFVSARGVVTIVAHLAYGVSTALTHRGLRRVQTAERVAA